ncbi:NADP-dependent oxidoreductase [Staphylococcus equorum]|uniref:NADP-dependent oxidoreductase n=1 Tax=Staphylococcus equorum TaxID=246432 RepID=UPI000B1ABF66|nr:NADP-dependent oxidoreductase [Staphylococcus equorum]
MIKVIATTNNPADVKIREGALGTSLEFPPFIPNYDLSEVIDKVGDSVQEFQVSDHVYAFLDVTKNGAAAEYAVARSVDVALAPKNISLEDAGVIPSSAVTAWQGLIDYGKLQEGQRVLVTAAAGGVGHFAVQFAKWKGAYVIGTVSERSSFSYLEEIGIDEIIDYKNETVTEKMEEKLDLIFNLSPLSSEEVTKLLLKKGGTLVTARNPVDDEKANELGVHGISMTAKSSSKQLSQIAKLVDNGFVKPWITELDSLENLKDIHEKFRSTNGKMLIKVNPN